MDAHNTTVATIAARVRRFSATNTPFRIYHGSTNSTRPISLHRANLVDTSSLNRVLKIDTHARTALVEPNVPMDQLVAATLRHRLVPPVVMEFSGITVGGGFSGMGGESSSFRYGMFDENVNWVEVVLGDGRVVVASAEEKGGQGERRTDLFHGLAGSMGSLGITTLLELRLVQASPFVQISYWPVSSVRETMDKVRAETARPPGTVDYVDAILFAADRGVVVSARLTEDISDGGSVQRFSRARDPWFYIHAAEKGAAAAGAAAAAGGSTPPVVIETVPLTDYLFRYDRGAFWTGWYAFVYFMVPFTALMRWLLDGFMHTRVMYHALHRSGFAGRYVIQDLALPGAREAEEFVGFVEERTGRGKGREKGKGKGMDVGVDVDVMDCFPLWVCPLKKKGRGRGSGGYGSFHPRWITSPAQAPPSYADVAAAKGKGKGKGKDAETPLHSTSNSDLDVNDDDGMSINIGLWCPGPSNKDDFVALNRAIEHKVRDLRGTKWLYARTYYTEREFWEIYDREWYVALREKYGAGYLPDVYEKVRVRDEDGKGRRGLMGGMMEWVWGIWPLAGLYGVMSAWIGGRGYLLEEGRRGRKVGMMALAGMVVWVVWRGLGRF
ncbi:hypothetical protein AJ79_07756 [Helicocarpus griseus UAMH5409]|uniref:Delta(24)-sterol reductase n=1 Tax=Helicocarpus griseus UAMH5409 TaxID=1447875 RepID=A0A2B7X018_9EURO|nr:hypothetical protein AJ79_07756 [Helicocarpus griseus UAMH5409]